MLRLLQLHLKINEDGLCGLDYLEIIPSTGTRRKFCGSLQQYTAQYSTYFTSNDVMLHFHSDWLGGGRGYLIDYAVSTACGSSIHRNRSGTIFTLGPTSDLFSIEGQSDWENCTTTIHVPYGYHIELVVSTDLEGNYTAGSDAIQFSKVTQSVGDTLNSLIYNCSEIFIELVDQRGSYILCGLKSVVNGNYLSKSNTLLVSVFRDKSKSCPRTTVSYVAVENNRSQSACPYGWVAGMDYCYLMDETPLSWIEAKHSCTKKGGRLVSIPNSDVQKLLDAIIDNR